MQRAYALPAPAKLNLFLHVLGRRDDGYHELQSALVLIDFADWLDIERRDDGAIVRTGDLLGPPDDDLAVRAARRLQAASGARHGATIRVSKRIPAGAGLGGGSSDAATTLLALNRMWDCGLARAELAALALELGADVPFFVHGNNAFAEGRGERLAALHPPSSHYAVVWPQVHVSTREIFADPGLTRSGKATKMADFSAFVDAHGLSRLYGRNDLQEVALQRAPEIGAALTHLAAFGCARMTGSGSAVFVPVADAGTALRAAQSAPAGCTAWAVRQLAEHPLRAW
jgi:4-diphosphocytidyl-2-C-methyl-D-erythritol kinase